MHMHSLKMQQHHVSEHIKSIAFQVCLCMPTVTGIYQGTVDFNGCTEVSCEKYVAHLGKWQKLCSSFVCIIVPSKDLSL